MGTEDKIKLAYLTRKKKQLRITIILLVISAALFIIGSSAGICAIVLKDQYYAELIGISEATAYEEKISSYKAAIDVDPDDPRAYRCLLDAYEGKGAFDKKESSLFLSLYNRARLDPDEAETAELRYKAGRMYMVIYSEDGEEPSFATRIQKAAPFFAENAASEADYSEKPINDCFHIICDFYKTYVFESSTVKETDATAVSDLIKSIQTAVESANEADAYDQLFMYTNALNLIYDRRLMLANAGYPLDSVLSLIDEMSKRSEALAVEKEVTKALQEEILIKQGTVRQAVEASYNGR